jgi:hypothetical protein
MTVDSEGRERRTTFCQDNPEKHVVKEPDMNNLDMYTREKANKVHLDEMQREAQNRRMLREVERETDPKNIAVNRRRYIALAVSMLIALIASFLVATNMGLLPTL